MKKDLWYINDKNDMSWLTTLTIIFYEIVNIYVATFGLMLLNVAQQVTKIVTDWLQRLNLLTSHVFSFSIAVQHVLFDFDWKKIFNKRLAFPPLYRDFYILVIAILNITGYKEQYLFF